MALRTHSVAHDLRHTHVALLIAEGEDSYAISRRLGRFPARTTQEVYGNTE